MFEDHRDRGFVLLEVLVGAAILGLTGTAILSVSSGIVGRSERDLEGSVAVMNAALLADELRIVGSAALEMPPDIPDKSHKYEFIAVPDQDQRYGGRLRLAKIEVRAPASDVVIFSLDVVFPTGARR